MSWFSDLTCSLKQACHRLEDRWCTCKSESSCLAWTISASRSSYFSNYFSNMNNHWVLVNTVARLTRSSPALSSSFTVNDFLEFFTDKVSQLRNNIISQQLSSTMTDQCSVSWPTSAILNTSLSEGCVPLTYNL